MTDNQLSLTGKLSPQFNKAASPNSRPGSANLYGAWKSQSTTIGSGQHRQRPPSALQRASVAQGEGQEAARMQSSSPDHTYTTSRKAMKVAQTSLGFGELDELQQLMAGLEGAESGPLLLHKARPKSACVSAAAWKAYGSPSIREAAITARKSRGLENAFATVSSLQHNHFSGAVSGHVPSIGKLGGGYRYPHAPKVARPKLDPSKVPEAVDVGTRAVGAVPVLYRPANAPVVGLTTAAEADFRQNVADEYRFTPTQPTDPDANRVWSELLKRHSAAQAASHTSTPPPRVSSLSGNASRPHSAAPGGRPLPARPMSASPAPVTVDSWGGRTSTAPLHHQHQQRPWSSSPTAMSRSPADHPGGQQLLSLYGGTSRPTSAYQPLARAVSAREQPRPRFSSVSVATIAQLGPDFRPPAVSGFSEPEAELVVPDPGDARWTYSRLGTSALARLQHSIKMAPGQLTLQQSHALMAAEAAARPSSPTRRSTRPATAPSHGGGAGAGAGGRPHAHVRPASSTTISISSMQAAEVQQHDVSMNGMPEPQQHLEVQKPCSLAQQHDGLQHAEDQLLVGGLQDMEHPPEFLHTDDGLQSAGYTGAAENLVQGRSHGPNELVVDQPQEGAEADAFLLTQQAADDIGGLPEHTMPVSGHASYREGHSDDEEQQQQGDKQGEQHERDHDHGSLPSASPWAHTESAQHPTQQWQDNQPTPGLTTAEATAVAALAGPPPSTPTTAGASVKANELQGQHQGVAPEPEGSSQEQPEEGSGGGMAGVWAELQDGVLAALTARGGEGVFGLDPRARGRHVPGQQQAASNIVQGLSSMGEDGAEQAAEPGDTVAVPVAEQNVQEGG